MKGIIARMIRLHSVKEELNGANSYIDYLEKEVTYLREVLTKSVSDIAQLTNDKNRKGRDLDALKGTARRLRDRLISHGCTPAEKEFLRVCGDIHNNGKMISRERFNCMVQTMISERKKACATEFNHGGLYGNGPSGVNAAHT